MSAINKIHLAHIESFEESLQFTWNALDRYQSVSSQSAFYPGRGTPIGIDYCALKLNGEAGELAEHIGKAMRDDGLIRMSLANDCAFFQPLTPERRELILKEIGDCLWYLGALSRELNTTLSEVALMNLRKIYERQENGTQRGSGDKR